MSNLRSSASIGGFIHLCALCVLCGYLLCPLGTAAGSDLDEFKVKREAVFEFAEKPAVSRRGDEVTIRFAAKGFCDATVAVEDPEGRIVRHLASGVLGPNAPEPFQQASKSQVILWDGKDDQGRYIDGKEALTVRVSLGLNPRFERTLFWSPKKRIGPGHPPIVAAAPEGVYVYEGGGVDHLRLFDHQGNYVRTIYPVRSDQLEQVKGLQWAVFPQDGGRLPLWRGLVQATLFTSGDNTGDNTLNKYGRAASAMAICGSRIALARRSLNRFATDGTTGGLVLDGPSTACPAKARDGPSEAYPLSAAFSPDGRYLYLTGYVWYRGYPEGQDWLHAVLRLEYAGDGEPTVFVGSLKERDAGQDNAHFAAPTSVACDAKGRVYVADYANDRIQVFNPDGAHHKTIAPVTHPASIAVHQRTGEIYVFSWMLSNRYFREENPKVEPTFTRLGPLEEPRVLASYPLPLVGHNPTMNFNRTGGLQHAAYLDPYTDPPTIWLVPGTGGTTEKLSQLRQDYSPSQVHLSPWGASQLRLLVEKAGQLAEVHDFAKDVAQAVVRVAPPRPPSCDRQRLYVDPTTGLLYVAEGDSGVGKAFRELVEIDPQTGKIALRRVPFTTEDMAFDLDGLIYLRTDRQVARFNRKTWQEVPWDYGEMWPKPGFDGDGQALVAAAALPGTGRPGCFHLGGFAISPRGRMVVSCYNVRPLDVRIPGAFSAKFEAGRPYTPPLFPGRLRWAEVHVWDRHGQPLYRDAVPGLPMTDGLAMDADDNIYVLAAANRVLDGKEYLIERAETLMKFKPGAGRILSSKDDIPLQLSAEGQPSRPPDLARGFAGQAWVEGAEWLYGGVGFGGFNSAKGGGGCACWNARFALDLFARSFVTELNRSTVAILDTNGNLILRVGRYGNVDEGRPLVLAGGPSDPRSIGGDEVALVHPSYVGTHTDRRLFIADYGNWRLLSVRLDYHATERVLLKDVPDAGP